MKSFASRKPNPCGPASGFRIGSSSESSIATGRRKASATGTLAAAPGGRSSTISGTPPMRSPCGAKKRNRLRANHKQDPSATFAERRATDRRILSPARRRDFRRVASASRPDFRATRHRAGHSNLGGDGRSLLPRTHLPPRPLPRNGRHPRRPVDVVTKASGRRKPAGYAQQKETCPNFKMIMGLMRAPTAGWSARPDQVPMYREYRPRAMPMSSVPLMIARPSRKTVSS